MKFRSTRQQTRDRAVKIYRHLIHGLAPSDIVKTEQMSEKQVYWYIQEGGRILGGDLQVIAKEGLLRELILHCRERRKQAWLLFATAKQETVKASMLNHLVDEDHQLIDLAERLKVLEPKVTKIEHGGGIEVRHQFFADVIRRSKTGLAPTMTHDGNGHLSASRN